eukprot:SAG31_NODE_3010_length_4788_cov_4.266098_5_plen_81_part_00
MPPQLCARPEKALGCIQIHMTHVYLKPRNQEDEVAALDDLNKPSSAAVLRCNERLLVEWRRMQFYLAFCSSVVKSNVFIL